MVKSRSASMLKLLPVAAAIAIAAALPAWSQKGKKGGRGVSQQSQTQAFLANGMHVIVSPSDNEIISVIVGLEGGFATAEAQNPAITEFTSDVITSSGSASMPKEALRRFLAQTATTITGGGDYRGMTFSMTTTRPNFDKAWDVLASMITAPSLDEIEYRNILQRRVADVKRRWTNPESHASIIADSLVKLRNPTLGRYITQSDLEGITMQGMEEFMKRVSERSRMLIVVVGKISQNDMERKLAAFSSLPLGSYARPAMPPLTAAPNPVVEVVDRGGSPTTYVQGSFAGPRADDPDFWPLQVGLNHLRGILFEEVRTKRNLSYAPGSSLSSTLGHSRGVISVSSTLPDSAISVMLRELEKMRRGEIDEKELESSKQVFLTSSYMRQMTNSGLANALYSAQRNSGDWHRAFSMEAIMAVNKTSVQRAFSKYARNLQFGVVGNKAQVTDSKYFFH